MRATLVAPGPVDALTREQAKANKLCRKVKKRKTKYVAAKEWRSRRRGGPGVTATCAECANATRLGGIPIDQRGAQPCSSGYEEVRRLCRHATGRLDRRRTTRSGGHGDDYNFYDFNGVAGQLHRTRTPRSARDTAKVTMLSNRSRLYEEMKRVQRQVLLGWDTSSVTNMYGAFYEAASSLAQPARLSQATVWSTPGVAVGRTEMYGAFYEAAPSAASRSSRYDAPCTRIAFTDERNCEPNIGRHVLLRSQARTYAAEEAGR